MLLHPSYTEMTQTKTAITRVSAHNLCRVVHEDGRIQDLVRKGTLTPGGGCLQVEIRRVEKFLPWGEVMGDSTPTLICPCVPHASSRTELYITTFCTRATGFLRACHVKMPQILYLSL